MKTHYSTFLGARMWPARPSFTSGGGLHRRTTIAYWMRESTLECFRLILSLHTWCKVISSARVRTQHCTFGGDKMDHLRHWSTVVQDLKNLRTPLSPPRPRTSLPSPHWLQQWTNHVPTISYLVALITSTQSRERAPDQKCLDNADIYKFRERADIYKFWERADIYKFWRENWFSDKQEFWSDREAAELNRFQRE